MDLSCRWVAVRHHDSDRRALVLRVGTDAKRYNGAGLALSTPPPPLPVYGGGRNVRRSGGCHGKAAGEGAAGQTVGPVGGGVNSALTHFTRKYPSPKMSRVRHAPRKVRQFDGRASARARQPSPKHIFFGVSQQADNRQWTAQLGKLRHDTPLQHLVLRAK